MSRRAILWLLCVPLMLGGTEAAHWLAFRLVYPDPSTRASVLQTTGHGYFAFLPLLGGAGLALVLCTLCLHARTARRTPAGPPLGFSAFAALPPLAFALQEHLERLLANGTLAGTVFEPTFMLGLVIQLPFALLAYLLARLLLGAAERIGLRLRPKEAPKIVGEGLAWWVASALSLPHTPALAGAHSGRGPPPARRVKHARS